MLQASSPAKEGPYTASKWLKVPLLLEGDEMAELLKELGEGGFYITSGVVKEGFFPRWLSCYRDYVDALKEGTVMTEEVRAPFSSVWSTKPECLYEQPVGDRCLVRVRAPVIQLRPHAIHYSPLDGKIRSMSPGISWGVEFSYPTLVQDPQTGQIEKVDGRFVNTDPFKRLQRWTRRNTLPTPFLIEGEKTTVPIRLGKGCFSWINTHPQLGELEVIS